MLITPYGFFLGSHIEPAGGHTHAHRNLENPEEFIAVKGGTLDDLKKMLRNPELLRVKKSVC